MSIKNRIQNLENQLSKNKPHYTYKLTEEEIAGKKRAFRLMMGNIKPTSDFFWKPLEKCLVDEILENTKCKLSREKIGEQITHFFSEVLTTIDERAEFLVEKLFGDVLPDDYEYRMIQKYIDFLGN